MDGAIPLRDMTAQPLQFSQAPLVGPLTPSAGFSFDRASLTVAAANTAAPMEPKKLRVYVPNNFIHRKIWASVNTFSNVWTGSSGNLVTAMVLKSTMRFYQGSHAVGKLESVGIAQASNGAMPVLQKSLPRLFGASGFSYNNVQRPACVSFYDAGQVFSTMIASWIGGSSWVLEKCTGVQAISCGFTMQGEFDAVEIEAMPQIFNTTAGYVDGWNFQTSPPLLYNLNLCILSQNEPFPNRK